MGDPALTLLRQLDAVGAGEQAIEGIAARKTRPAKRASK
jgi:hypothetical protein